MEQRNEAVDVARTGAVPGTLGVVGLGLMGASLARAARVVAPAVRIVAVEPREDVRAQAIRDGVADEAHAAPGPASASASGPASRAASASADATRYGRCETVATAPS